MKKHIISESLQVKDAHFIEDCPKWKIPGTDWTLQGYSVAGERTGFMVNPIKLFLDGGMNSYKKVDNLLLTHSHSDHSFNIPCLAMGRDSIENKPKIYCPIEMTEPLKLLCRASQSLNDCVSLIKEEQIRYSSVKSGDNFSIKLNKNNFIKINVFDCCHTVPTVGYLISQDIKILKQQYQKLIDQGKGKELGNLRKKGIDIYETKNKIKFAFLGDTTIDVFNKSPIILKSPIIIIECTAFGNAISEKQAYDRGHIHWEQLSPIVNKNKNIIFVLIHFSRRYKEDEIIEYFLKQENKNLILWLKNKVISLIEIKK
jgi:ribonuclease Z